MPYTPKLGNITQIGKASIIKSKQEFAITIMGSGATSANLSISSVDVNNTILLTGSQLAFSNGVGEADWNKAMMYVQLNSSTNINAIKNTAYGNASWYSRRRGSVLEFEKGVLRRSVQRGVHSLAVGSGITTISTGAIFTAPTNLSKTFLNICGVSITTAGAGASNNSGTLLSFTMRLNGAGTGIDIEFDGFINTSYTCNISYEVYEFD